MIGFKFSNLRGLSARLLCCMALWLLGAMSALAAEEYPTRPVRIVAWGPGNVPDVMCRIIAEELRNAWKQPVIVVNKAGVGGILAAQEGAQSPADGYTIVFGDPVGWEMFKRFRADDKDRFPPDALRPVTVIADTPMVIVAAPSLPVKTLPELIDYARAQARPLRYGTPGIFSLHHLALELLAEKAGIKLEHVPYKVITEAIPAVSAGELSLAASGVTTLEGWLRDGRLRGIAVTSEKRLPQLPNLPPVADTLPGYEAIIRVAFFLHRDTPPALAERIGADLSAAIRSPKVLEIINRTGSIASGASAAEAEKIIRRDIEMLAPVGQRIKDAGL
jgi:tripartite-type tricarboxylate transporter receptor subunit TctC